MNKRHIIGLALLLMSILSFVGFSVSRAQIDSGHGGTATGLAHAAASSDTQPLALKLHATIESAGVVSPFLGDDNNNNHAVVYYRKSGTTSWQEGHAMDRDKDARVWRVSLVYLSPNTEYEVEVRYQDADGVSPDIVSGSVHTRPDYPAIGANGTITTVSPQDNLQAVLDQANAGDTIQLLGGVYHVGNIDLNSSHSGRSGRYITIEPAPSAHVIFDGSDTSVNSGQDDWTFYQSSAQGDIYYTDLSWGDTSCSPGLQPGYVGELIGNQGTRYLLYDSGSNSWENDFVIAPAGKAYYVCNGSGPGPNKRLYVVTYSGTDPDDHEMHVARYGNAFGLQGAAYLRVRGIEFRYYSDTAIHLYSTSSSGADNNIIENNIFHGIGRRHITLTGRDGEDFVSDNLVQNNYIYEVGYRNSAWERYVEYQVARGGVNGIYLFNTGPGNVVRGNQIVSGHDGIAIKRGSGDVDLYNNTITECMDDALEVDNNPGHNIRIFNNWFTYCYTSISLQDWDADNPGPLYIFRNVMIGDNDPQGRRDHKGSDAGYDTYTIFKVGGDARTDGRTYLYHNTILMRTSPKGNGIAGAGGNYFSGAVSRNNIWNVTGLVYSLKESTQVVDHDFDCDNLHDLYSNNAPFIKWTMSGGPNGDGVYRSFSEFRSFINQQAHGISDARTRFNGALELEEGSPDINAGCIIKGFNDRGPNIYAGTAPDMGAFEVAYGFRVMPSPPAQAVDAGGVATYVLEIQRLGDFSEEISIEVANPWSDVSLDLNADTLTITDARDNPSPDPGMWHSFVITARGGDIVETAKVGVLFGGKRFYVPFVTKNSP